MNPVLQMLNQTKLGPIVQMFKAVRSATDPNAALQQMASSNPLVKQAVDLVQKNGGNAEAAFRAAAQQAGIDENSILSMLK